MNVIEFANPLGWWWAALAVPIIALYVLKVRLRRQRVSTFLFWDRLFDEKKPRAWWQQLRHWLSLLLQLALLLLLVGALVDPLWSWQKSERRKLVLVVDNSASMAAELKSGSGRIDQAKHAARSLIRSLRAGDQMAILTAGGKASVAIGLTDHTRSLIEALDRIALTDAPSALESTVTTAQRLIPDERSSRIIVLTDGCDPATEALSQLPGLTLYGFGEPADNVAITQFQARRSVLDSIGYQVLVEVANLGSESQKCQLDLTLEDQLVDVVPLELEPGESKTLNLDQMSSEGGRLLARIDTIDGLSIDNSAMAIVPVRHTMPILLVTPGSLFLRSVIESIPLTDLEVSSTYAPPAAGANERVVILHQQVPAQLPPGKVLVVDPRTDCDLWSLGESIDQPIVGNVHEDSPVTRQVHLDNVIFPGARQITFNTLAEALIGTPLDEPLLAHIRRPSGDVLVLNLNLDEGDLPLRIAFPVFMKNAIEWFQGVRAELQASVSTGQPATVEFPQAVQRLPLQTLSHSTEGAASQSNGLQPMAVGKERTTKVDEDFWLRDPAGHMAPLAHDERRATIALLTHCGLWTIGSKEDLLRDPWAKGRQKVAPEVLIGPAPGPVAGPATGAVTGTAVETATGEVLGADKPSSDSNASANAAGSGSSPRAAGIRLDDRLVRVASNLCNREESDLRPRIVLGQPGTVALMGLGGWSIWFYLAAMALAFCAIEWWLYQRRVVG